MTGQEKSAVVTGAGSGVGRSVAIALAAKGWSLALLGRRREALEETARVAGRPDRFFICPCDVGCQEAVAAAASQVLDKFGDIEVLVNAAGTNVRERSLANLDPSDYRRVVETNLNGSFYTVHAFLPSMRKRGGGTIVNVVSDAGREVNAYSGASYVASKFGQLGLTQTINVEEARNGIRATAIMPGEIDTPLVDMRPNPPPAERRAKMLQPEDIVACILLAIDLPPRAILEEVMVRPAVRFAP